MKDLSMMETERLILRHFNENDAQDILGFLGEPQVNCFADMKLNSYEEAASYARRISTDENCFAIVLKENKKVIGLIDAHEEEHSHTEKGTPPDTFSPCWMLNSEYQKKGYAFEAAYAFFDYLFTHKGARRIYAYTEDYNLSSQHLCEKLGMRREGIFMEFVAFINDEDGNPVYENTMQYAILKKEWEANKNR